MTPRPPFTEPYQVNQDAESIDRRNLYGGSFDAHYFGSALEVTSVTGYQTTQRSSGPGGLDSDLSPLPFIVSTYGVSGFNKPGYKNNVWTEEFRVSSARSPDNAFAWTVGAYGFRQRAPLFLDLFFDASLSPFKQSYHRLSEDHTDVDGHAFFGQSTYTVAPKLDLTLGLRYDRQTTTQSSKVNIRLNNGTTMPGTTASLGSPSTAVSPKASIAYRASGQVLTYASYARGYRAGGVNLSGLSSPAPSVCGPEYTNNYEIGFKGSTNDGRLRANLAAFYIDWIDAQVSAFDLVTFASATVNTGKVKSKGVELDAVPVNRLQVDWNVGYTDAKYDKLNTSLTQGMPADYSGKRPPFVPNVTSTLAPLVDILIGVQNTTLTLRGEWRYLGTQYFDLGNTVAQKGCSLFGSTATLRTRNVDVAAFGNNLGDKRYLAYGFVPDFLMLGAPRTYGVKVTVRPWQ